MLTDSEKEKLRYHEELLTEKLDSFFEVADSLIVIRDEKLYRDNYGTFADYCERRWHFSNRYARYLIRARKIADVLIQEGVQQPLNESQIRPLSSIPFEDVANVWRQATSLDGQGNPSTAQVKRAADEYFVQHSPYVFVKEAVANQQLDIEKAKQAVVALNSCEPSVRNLVERMRVSNTTIIHELNRMRHNGSAVYDEIAASGYIQFEDGTGVRIDHASATDLRRKLDEEMTNHKREELIARGQVLVSVRKGDPDKTFEELRKVLDEDDLTALYQKMLEWRSQKLMQERNYATAPDTITFVPDRQSSSQYALRQVSTGFGANIVYTGE